MRNGSVASEDVADDVLADTPLVALGRLFVLLDEALGDPERFGTVAPGLNGSLALALLDRTGQARPSELAEATSLGSGGLTLLLDRLEQGGLVARDRDPGLPDRRAVVVHLTDAGRGVLSEVEQVVLEASEGLANWLQELGRDAGSTRDVDPGDPPEVLVALLEMVRHLDTAALTVVSPDGPLDPADPRGMLLLLEMCRQGELPLADVPGLVGRSRGTCHRLLRRLEQAGISERARVPGAGSRVVVRPTPEGRLVGRRFMAEVVDRLPAMAPAIEGFVHARSRAVSRTGSGAFPPFPRDGLRQESKVMPR
jgi:DNA-binding MarR family transcriptional regulator